MTREEMRILSGMLGSSCGIDELFDDPAPLRRLCKAYAGRTDCAAVLSAVSRPLLHQIKIAGRERSQDRAISAFRVWRHLMDARLPGRVVLLIGRRQVRRVGAARRSAAALDATRYGSVVRPSPSTVSS